MRKIELFIHRPFAVNSALILMAIIMFICLNLMFIPSWENPNDIKNYLTEGQLRIASAMFSEVLWIFLACLSFIGLLLRLPWARIYTALLIIFMALALCIYGTLYASILPFNGTLLFVHVFPAVPLSWNAWSLLKSADVRAYFERGNDSGYL